MCSQGSNTFCVCLNSAKLSLLRMVTTLGRVDPLQDLRRRFGPVDTSVRFLTTVDVHLAAPLQPNLLRLHK